MSILSYLNRFKYDDLSLSFTNYYSFTPIIPIIFIEYKTLNIKFYIKKGINMNILLKGVK